VGHPEPAQEPSPLSVQVAYGRFTADLLFDETLPLEAHQQMVVVGGSYAFEDGWRLGGSIGVIVGGTLRGPDHALTFDPGFVATVQAGVTLIEGDRWWPFLESTVNLSISHATLRDAEGVQAPWTALDLRLGATSGWRILDVWVPYVAFRFFAGPVFWRDGGADRVGSDRHHYQLAIGSTVTLWGVDLFVDWGLPLGEAGLSAGAGYRF